MVNSGKKCSSEKIVKDMQNLLEQNLESDPLIPIISKDDKNTINIAIKQCDNEYLKCNGDAKCQNIAKNNLIRRLPWKKDNIYPWRNYDYNYFNSVQKNYNKKSTGMKESTFTLNDVLDNTKSIETVFNGYLEDPIPTEKGLAGSSTDISDKTKYDYGYSHNPSDNKFNTDSYQCECKLITDCIEAAKNDLTKRQCDNTCIRTCFNNHKNDCIKNYRQFVRCGARNTMANRTSNLYKKPFRDSFFDINKLKGKYSSSYYTKIGGCPRNDINNEKKCKDNNLKWNNDKTKKLFSEIAGCKDHCSCQSKKYPNNYCSSIVKKTDCKGSCRWNNKDKSNQYCEEKPPNCQDWNRVDCEGGPNLGGGKCRWDEATAKCKNKYLGFEENKNNENSSKILESCINNDKATCVAPCEWSAEKNICSVPLLKCSDLKEKNKCSGTCIWSDNNCKEKSLICKDRTRDSCSGTCEWKFFHEPPDTNFNGSCTSDRYMFIDNSPKSFVDGNEGKGLIQSIGSDMLSITPDKIFYAATGKSVPGSFEHQKCVNISEFNMNGTLRGFTSSTFNFKARESYLQELQEILKNNYIKDAFSLAIDLVQNVTNDSILFTIIIYKIYQNNDTIMDDLQSFINDFPSKKKQFLTSLSKKLIEKKVYFNRQVFNNQTIVFNNIICKTNCPVETFLNYKENSESNENIRKNGNTKLTNVLCVALFLVIISLINYLFCRN